MMTNEQIDRCDVTQMNPLEAILILAERLGLHGLAQRYEGRCWEYQVDSSWWFALNPNAGELACSHGAKVPGYHVLVEFNGWPAGVFNLAGQGTFARGAGANEDAFNVACLVAAKKAAVLS